MTEKNESSPAEQSKGRFVGVCKNILEKADIELQSNFKLVEVDTLKPPLGDEEEKIVSQENWTHMMKSKDKTPLEMWPNLHGEKKLFAVKNGDDIYWMNFADYGPAGDVKDKLDMQARLASEASRREGGNLVGGLYRGDLPSHVEDLLRGRALKALNVEPDKFKKYHESWLIKARRVGLAEGSTGSRIGRAMDKLASVVRLPNFTIPNLFYETRKHSKNYETKAGEGWAELIRIGEVKD